MHISNTNEICRRAFLQRLAALSAVGAGSSYALGLAGIGEIAAQEGREDYRALVCVFLSGGNDHANTLIPYDSENYARYFALRGGPSGVGIERQSLASSVLFQPEDQKLTDGITYALAPSMPNLKRLFDQGTMAPLLNVGPLLAPLTRAQYESTNTQAYPRPSKLFSHNDQRATWQAFEPEGAGLGWGGRIGDLALSSNRNAMFTAISVSGSTVFLNGNDSIAYRVAPSGPIKMIGINGNLYGSSTASEALRELLTQQSGHVLENDYAAVNARSIEYNAFVEEILDSSPASTKFGDGSPLSESLSTVARLIAGREALGAKRQVFFVNTGGFDNHSNLKSKHQGLLAGLDSALAAFNQAIERLGLAEEVTTFTASDFGRTLTSNGNGTDHGWGGHHFIMGGAVNGGRFYGRAPHVSVETADQVGDGRLLPTTSVDEYAATLARWFGVPDSSLAMIAPNLGRFSTSNLGFMK